MNKKYQFGIVIGRFQPFHSAHQALIEHALTLAEKIIVILGSARSASDVKNPFTPAMREEIILACFPKDADRFIFRAVRDYPYNDHVWTTEIQNTVNEIVEEFESTTTRHIPEEFKKYVNFQRGEERLLYADKENFPIYKTKKEKESKIRPKHQQTSADRIKILTDEITGVFADDAQNNLLIIQRFFNDRQKHNMPILLEPQLANGAAYFRTSHGNILPLSLTDNNSKPDKLEFEISIKKLLELSEKKTQHQNVAIIGFFKDRSSYYLNLFPQWNFEEFYRADKKLSGINATNIREKYFAGNAEWRENLPPAVVAMLDVFQQTETFAHLQKEFQYLQKYKADTEFKGVNFAPVFVTTDAIVVQSGHVLVVRRNHHPGKGLLALPGGFLKENLTLEDNAIKELKEETQIKIPAQVLRGSIKTSHVFDYPERSQRGRTVTFAYFIELQSNLKDGLPHVKGGDDAERAFWLPLSGLGEKEDQFFEDHLHIIKYFLGI